MLNDSCTSYSITNIYRLNRTLSIKCKTSLSKQERTVPGEALKFNSTPVAAEHLALKGCMLKVKTPIRK
jgi:hypothetical protein